MIGAKKNQLSHPGCPQVTKSAHKSIDSRIDFNKNPFHLGNMKFLCAVSTLLLGSPLLITASNVRGVGSQKRGLKETKKAADKDMKGSKNKVYSTIADYQDHYLVSDVV